MNFNSIIKSWPSVTSLAQDLSRERGKKVSAYCVQKWGERDNIPNCFWADIVKLSPEVGLEISIEQLADISRNRSLA